MHRNKLRPFRHSLEPVHHRLLSTLSAGNDDAHLPIQRTDPADFGHPVLARDDDDGVDHLMIVEHAQRPAQNRKPAQLRQKLVRPAHPGRRPGGDNHRRTARMRELVFHLPRLADAICKLHEIPPYVRLPTSSL